jgi:hypothetical protein
MAKTITAIVPLKGISTGKRTTKFEADGFQGEGCKTATEAFQSVLGGVTEEELKSEYYETEERKEFLREGDGDGGDGGDGGG